MTRLEIALACFAGIVGTVLMIGGIWTFQGSLDFTQRALMFLLGLSHNIAIVITIIWKLEPFTKG